MSDDPSGAVAAVRRLPPDALTGLREAFAAEVAERLPRLRSAAAVQGAGDRFDADALTTALRDAHSLGSSAVVVGEPEVSRCARHAEQLLLEWQAGNAPVSFATELSTRVEALSARLERWQP